MSLRSSFKGWLGEVLISGAKKLALDGDVYRDINNVTLAISDGTTQIDHIIVSRYGIFVIETKNMEGWIFGSENQARWTQSLYRKKQQFQNPLRQNFRHTKALEEFLGLGPEVFHSVVCFIGTTCEFKTPLPPNVIRGEPFTYIKSKTAVLLPDAQVAEVVQAIKTGMRPKNFLGLTTAATRREHLDSLKARRERTARPLNPAPPKTPSSYLNSLTVSHEWGSKPSSPPPKAPPSHLNSHTASHEWGAKPSSPSPAPKAPASYLNKLIAACGDNMEETARRIAVEKSRARMPIDQEEAIKRALERLWQEKS